MCKAVEDYGLRREARGIVAMCKDFGMSFSDTVAKIVSKLGITQEEANETVKKYWD